MRCVRWSVRRSFVLVSVVLTVTLASRASAETHETDVTGGVCHSAAWGGPDADINGDGNTDGGDLGLFLSVWGDC